MTHCIVCGKPIIVKSPAQLKKRKHCSKACYMITQRTNIEMKCEICGKTFYANKRRQGNKHHYCSVKCRAKGKTVQPNRACLVCGKLFYATDKCVLEGRGKYCSKECYYRSEGNPPVLTTCLYCGNEFYAEYYKVATNKKKFCSRKCWGKWKSNNIKGSAHPNWNNNLTDEDRERERCVDGYKEWRLAVFTRDNFTCQHCGDSTGGNLNAHHIIPFSKDESLRTELSNGITLCAKCHKKEHKRLKNMLKDNLDFFVV